MNNNVTISFGKTFDDLGNVYRQMVSIRLTCEQLYELNKRVQVNAGKNYLNCTASRILAAVLNLRENPRYKSGYNTILNIKLTKKSA